jgi:hypothetical protein
MMDENAFWQIIADVGSIEGCSLEEALAARLAELDAESILGFHREFAKRVHQAYRFDLMAVASIINANETGEDYDAFVGWLIARGREAFEAALANPELAAVGATPKAAKSRALWAAPKLAYRERTGQDDFDLEATPISLVMEGVKLTKDEVEERFAALVARFS